MSGGGRRGTQNWTALQKNIRVSKRALVCGGTQKVPEEPRMFSYKPQSSWKNPKVPHRGSSTLAVERFLKEPFLSSSVCYCGGTLPGMLKELKSCRIRLIRESDQSQSLLPLGSSGNFYLLQTVIGRVIYTVGNLWGFLEDAELHERKTHTKGNCLVF